MSFAGIRSCALWALIVAATPVAGEPATELNSPAETREMGGGFRDHGIASPVSAARGVVATIDGEGRKVVLVWLHDHRGGYGLLMIEVESSRTRFFPTPFPTGGDTPFASILSSRNRYYTHFGNFFSEFDPEKRAFTLYRGTKPRSAMSMTEDDDGRIWSATYPNAGLVSFDPAAQTLKDYGHVHRRDWRQYPRSLAVDDQGQVYLGIGTATSQIVAFDPAKETAHTMLPDAEWRHGRARVHRHTNGKVYGYDPASDRWLELHDGKAKQLDGPPDTSEIHSIAGPQSLFHGSFRDGSRLRSLDLVKRELVVDGDKTPKTVTFDYPSAGAGVVTVAAAPNGSVVGGTAFPMRAFAYDPRRDRWTNRASHGQWNTLASQGDHVFVGAYTKGKLLDWEPKKPWVPTTLENPTSNPRWLATATPAVHRPHALLALPDDRTVILGGTPAYGRTGGGLLVWDRRTGEKTLLEHTDLLPEQSTYTLEAIPDGKILGGTTTRPGTGGKMKASEAELYVFDPTTGSIEWHEAVLPGAQQYTDLHARADGKVFGFADNERFFVFDPATRKLVHRERTVDRLGKTVWQHGSRVFIQGPAGTVYVLFREAIGRIAPGTQEIERLANSPVQIYTGGAFVGGRIYFADRARLYSYDVSTPQSSSRSAPRTSP